MHSVAKANQWLFGMRCQIGVDAASGLVHSVMNTAANVHELNTAADRVHGEERVIYGDSGHMGMEKLEAFKDYEADLSISMKPKQRRPLADIPKGRLVDLIEAAKANDRARSVNRFGSVNASLDFGRFAIEASARTTSS